MAARWPTGFRCPGCGADKSWPHGGKRFTYECASCGKQTSVTAGTILHGSKLPLTVWFWASYLVSTAFQRNFRAATAKATRVRLLHLVS
jgi:transposase-like protein